ncbi:unnamed protein product [Durusdinium trenchii]|uniref:Uncharacterized protein n=1 Tax=Durusdinium trenchii TaxID=1381693 RepID=A0ABP0PP75_9DINO
MAASDWLGVDEEKDQEQELLNRAVEVMLQLSQKFEARLWEHKTKMSTLRERERKLRMRGAMVRLLQKKGGWAEDSQTPVLTKASLWLLPHGEHLNVGSTGGSAGSWPCAVGRVSPDDRADDADDEIGMRRDKGWNRAKWMGNTSMSGPQDTIFESANPVHFGIPMPAKTAKTASFATCANLVRRSSASRRRVPAASEPACAEAGRDFKRATLKLVCARLAT